MKRMRIAKIAGMTLIRVNQIEEVAPMKIVQMKRRIFLSLIRMKIIRDTQLFTTFQKLTLSICDALFT